MYLIRARYSPGEISTCYLNKWCSHRENTIHREHSVRCDAYFAQLSRNFGQRARIYINPLNSLTYTYTYTYKKPFLLARFKKLRQDFSLFWLAQKHQRKWKFLTKALSTRSILEKRDDDVYILYTTLQHLSMCFTLRLAYRHCWSLLCAHERAKFTALDTIRLSLAIFVHKKVLLFKSRFNKLRNFIKKKFLSAQEKKKYYIYRGFVCCVPFE